MARRTVSDPALSPDPRKMSTRAREHTLVCTEQKREKMTRLRLKKTMGQLSTQTDSPMQSSLTHTVHRTQKCHEID